MTGVTHWHNNLLTWWESQDRALVVELRRERGGFLVRVLRAGQTSAEVFVSTETQGRTIFERTVTGLVEGEEDGDVD